MMRPSFGNKHLRFPFLPVAALLVSLITLCAGTSLAKGLFPHVGAEGTTTYRLIFSTLLLMAFWRPWRRQWSWNEAPVLILFGAILGFMNLLFYNAIKTVPFGLAIAIEFTGPLAVALWSSKKPLDFVWIVLAVIGLGLILPLAQYMGADTTQIRYFTNGEVALRGDWGKLRSEQHCPSVRCCFLEHATQLRPSVFDLHEK